MSATSELRFPSPKAESRPGKVDSWYRYYAGYSSSFVKYTLENVAPHAKTVLDPWNGTGTTTVVAAGRQQKSFGFDINPVTVVIARARLLGVGVKGSIKALADDISAHADPVRLPDDPLLFWFSADSAAQLRALEMSVHRLLVGSSDSMPGPVQTAENLSGLAAFFYTALFRTVRGLASPISGTNPTWWKRPLADGVLRIRKKTIIETFKSTAIELAEGLHRDSFDLSTSVTLGVADSRELPVLSDTIGAVVTSPPYCTRMDYGVATRPELAILRYDNPALTDLRAGMVGTPTVTGEDDTDDHLGELAAEFLAQVKGHNSYASSGYYTKFFRQYYAAMRASLDEIRRVTRDGAPAVLVIQDGYYKEVHNDTPGIIGSMGLAAGFGSVARHDFPVPRTIAGMNTASKKYRTASTAIESVVVLQ